MDTKEKSNLFLLHFHNILYVLKEYRNNGVATELINSFIKWSKEKNAYYIDLKVCNLNENAIKIYKKFGFYETKVIMTKNMEEL